MNTTSRIDKGIETLRDQIVGLERQLAELKAQLAQAETQADTDRSGSISPPETASLPNGQCKWPLAPEEYRRYGRQMIMPEVGLQGQLKLKASHVLVVGVGGLGCPAAAYLAGAGVGTIGLVDGDTVEMSNLHRQILHGTKTVGMAKVDSAIEYLRDLNPTITYHAHRAHLTPQTAIAIFSQYDLILDCTDHPTSRYLISDAAVLCGKPLVSASALRTEGQLMVLNDPPRPPGDLEGGPCYRCVFPKPPPAESVVSCGEGGILGPVVGVMGVLQALEAIKLLVAGVSKIPPAGQGSADQRAKKAGAPSLLLFSASGSPPFRSVRLRSRRASCQACSASASITEESVTSGSLDYVQFCGVLSPVELLSDHERVTATIYEGLRIKSQNPGMSRDHLLVDVREKVQFDICSLDGSINVPFSDIQSGNALRSQEDESTGHSKPSWIPQSFPPEASIHVVCRLGNDSQLAVRKLKEAGLDDGGKRYIGDIRGGWRAWRHEVDESWPDY
ncbi:MAG: Urmylation protein [Pycnora praestabilis]|nr:MAG: Urmylation protein [Pycnora praestabilis]